MSDVYCISIAEGDLLMEVSHGQASALLDLASAMNQHLAATAMKVRPVSQLKLHEADDILGTSTDPIVLQDVPSWRVVTAYLHLHIGDKCRKNRFAPRCTARPETQPSKEKVHD